MQSGPVARFFLSIHSDEVAKVLVDKITALIEPVITEMQLELVEVRFRREQVGQVLRLIIDSDTGVTIDHCAKVSREVGHLLEVEDIIDQAYHLEVSSPGLDRPLKTERDFKRYRGKKVNVKFFADEVLNDVTGIVADCEKNIVVLETKKRVLQIPIESIKKALQVIEF